MEDQYAADDQQIAFSSSYPTLLPDVEETTDKSSLRLRDGDEAVLKQRTVSKIEDFHAVAHGLESLPTALIIVDGAGRLFFANREAKRLLAEQSAIYLDSGGFIRCRVRCAQQQLQRLLRCSSSMPGTQMSSRKAAFVIPREEGRPLAALLTCEPSSKRADLAQGFDEAQRVFLMLRDPQRQTSDSSKWLMQLYGFSEAEAKVVSRLSEGASIQEIAIERDVSVVTIRNQLKSAHAKAGVNRQAELVSLVLRSTQF